jgi:hypothetical protein
MFFKLVAVAAASTLTACAAVEQNAPQLEIVSVHNVPGRTKQEICGAARDWAAVSFRDSNAVVQVYDAERGTMISKGNLLLAGAFSTPFDISFTLTVDCKDGKARSRWDGFAIRWRGIEYPLTEDPLNSIQTKARAAVANIDAGLYERLKSGAAETDF